MDSQQSGDGMGRARPPDAGEIARLRTFLGVYTDRNGTGVGSAADEAPDNIRHLGTKRVPSREVE
ncbi:hypothetical protein AB0E69_03735 [Kribbella sp. NPDC026611]|uniref:hypothetical protein n=1 Tax=Kribbella sp. NPDC026611 TaxID=3154911 RepID=UPI0033EF65A3